MDGVVRQPWRHLCEKRHWDGIQAIVIARECVHLWLSAPAIAQACKGMNALQTFREGGYLHKAFSSARDGFRE